VERKLGQGSTFHLTLPVFSLDKLCADIFTAPNLQAGSVTLTLIAVDVADGSIRDDVLPQVR